MNVSGYLRMLEYTGLEPVNYYLHYATYVVEKSKVLSTDLRTSTESLNCLIGKKLSFYFSGEIRCVNCGRKTKKSFNQGSCYPCFIGLAKNDMCILRPSTCHFEDGTCREPDWGKSNCFKEHHLYLANTSGVKVGITKENPITNRWIDQGAVAAVALYRLSNRKDAGLIEAEISKYMADKTSWQKMLFSKPEEMDLLEISNTVDTKVKDSGLFNGLTILPDRKVITIRYPVESIPLKKVSYSVKDKLQIEDTLVGIKGQYLLFANGVINLRTYAGYHFEVSVMGE
jgi:hypothetical protein